MTARTIALTLATAAAAALAALAPPAAAQVHRWVDAQGRVHYGDRPLGESGTTLRIRPEAATPPAAGSAGAGAAQRPAPPPRAAPLGAPAPAPKPATVDRLITQQRAAGPAAPPTARSPGMAQLIAECKANRGVDCETPQGMRRMQQENTPPTSEEQARIAGLRARKAACAGVRHALGC
jgi:hypothetical protein